MGETSGLERTWASRGGGRGRTGGDGHETCHGLKEKSAISAQKPNPERICTIELGVRSNSASQALPEIGCC
jgi:hypothetical protein